MDDFSIGVMLSTCHRLEYLPMQLEAIADQTIRPVRTMICHDGPKPPPAAKVPVITSSHQLGTWAPVYACLNFDTEYVCLFDDDTIPGSRWLENCLVTISECNGLVGTVGVRFQTAERKPRTKHGWVSANPEALRVDLVGHCWFFRREWLGAYVSEPRVPSLLTAGEDYHWAYVMQRLGLGLYVAPHPPHRAARSLWGSLCGNKLGNDRYALYRQKNASAEKNKAHTYYRQRGWRFLWEETGDDGDL